MSRTGDDPDAIIAEKGLQSIRNSAHLARMVREVISENPEIVSRIGSGEARLINFLIGQVMEKADGKAPAKEVGRLIRKHLRL
jgi:aspartyl-tRNA(Asn)/glutamyl-tRNA(Gln) amidotransferase subunit B